MVHSFIRSLHTAYLFYFDNANTKRGASTTRQLTGRFGGSVWTPVRRGLNSRDSLVLSAGRRLCGSRINKANIVARSHAGRDTAAWRKPGSDTDEAPSCLKKKKKPKMYEWPDKMFKRQIFTLLWLNGKKRSHDISVWIFVGINPANKTNTSLLKFNVTPQHPFS